MSNETQTQQAPAQPEAQLKQKKSRHNHRVILSETKTDLVTAVKHKAYKGEKIADTVRKDHKFDPKQRTFAGRPL